MEQIGNLVSREALTRSTERSDTPLRQITPKEMLGDGYYAFRQLMRRLSSDYNWELTEEDGLTWASLANKLGVDLWAKAVLAYLTDTSEDADGKPKCTFRPKVGEIMAYAERINKAREWEKRGEKTAQMMREETASDETVERCMEDIRSQSWYKRSATRRAAAR